MSSNQLAKKFIREQVEIMKRHGADPKLSPERKRDFMMATTRTFELMRRVSEPPAKQS